MRISTGQFYASSAANYQKNFANVVKSSEEASSLVRVNTAADDPVGASRLLQLGQQASMLAQYKINSNTIKATLGQAESVMTSITNVLQRAKELLTSTDLSVKEIAYRLNFETPDYFSSRFKIKTGRKPSELR